MRQVDAHTASADVEACFYQCRLDQALSPYFCLPGRTVDEARGLGLDLGHLNAAQLSGARRVYSERNAPAPSSLHPRQQRSASPQALTVIFLDSD